MTRRSRIILHGKQAANQELRDAVAAVREREDGHQIEVRVTWEAGDDPQTPEHAWIRKRKPRLGRLTALIG
jgi:hypothetical protein